MYNTARTWERRTFRTLRNLRCIPPLTPTSAHLPHRHHTLLPSDPRDYVAAARTSFNRIFPLWTSTSSLPAVPAGFSINTSVVTCLVAPLRNEIDVCLFPPDTPLPLLFLSILLPVSHFNFASRDTRRLRDTTCNGEHWRLVRRVFKQQVRPRV